VSEVPEISAWRSFGAILKILTHINERAVEVAEMLLDVTDDLRAERELRRTRDRNAARKEHTC